MYEQDLEILNLLRNRSSLSLRGITESLEFTPKQVKKRIKIMKETGIIQSWQIALNPHSFQQRIFFLLLKTNPNEPRIVSELLTNYDRNTLSTLEGITGEYSLIGRFYYPNTNSFLSSLEYLYGLIGETGFQKYQFIEVIKLHKERGFLVPETFHPLKRSELLRLKTIQNLGKTSLFPPSTRKMANSLNKSQPTISRQMNKWKKEGVILGFTIHTDYWDKNFIHAYVEVKTPLGHYDPVIVHCLTDDRVVDIYRTNQEYSLLLKTRHEKISDLNQFIQSLYQTSKVQDTLTRIVMDTLT